MRSLTTVSAGASPVTISEFKSFLKIDGTDEDAILQICLDAATDGIQKYIRRVLVSAQFDLWLDSFPPENEKNEYRIFGGSEIYLPNPPTLAVSSIKTYNESNTESTLSSSFYSVDAENGRVFLNDGYTWPTALRSKKSIKINYTCGYDTATPAALKQAVLSYAGQLYNSRCECEMADSVKKILAGYKLYDGLGY